MLEGRNLLRQMAERTKTHIKKAERRLGSLRASTDGSALQRRTLWPEHFVISLKYKHLRYLSRSVTCNLDQRLTLLVG